jgi:hypothetical protein
MVGKDARMTLSLLHPFAIEPVRAFAVVVRHLAG